MIQEHFEQQSSLRRGIDPCLRLRLSEIHRGLGRLLGLFVV